MRRISIALIWLAFPALAASGAMAMEELDIINRPVNTSGLTGLLITTSPFTLPPRTFEIGASVLSESSLVPKYISTAYPLTLSYGLTSNRELSLRIPYLYRNDDPNIKTRGMGDTDLFFKWNILPQPEQGARPGLAVIAAGTFPTGDGEAGTNSIDHWGCRFGIALGSEIFWEDRIIALYADGYTALQDLSDDMLRDSYTLLNAGVLFPISKYRNLQLLIEFNQMTGKDIENIDGGNYTAVTYGLRLVNERFNFTFGTQLIHKESEGYNNSSRVVGTISSKF